MNKREFNKMYGNKVGYDAENKKFLVRVYNPLLRTFTNNSRPKWVDVIEDMIGERKGDYYSSVRRTLKDIRVCYYDRDLGYFVKGENWDRFFSGESWDWFIMRTGSCEYSEVIK